MTTTTTTFFHPLLPANCYKSGVVASSFVSVPRSSSLQFRSLVSDSTSICGRSKFTGNLRRVSVIVSAAAKTEPLTVLVTRVQYKVKMITY
ncbi:hypothetical protein ISN44_As09g022200 [Arabidopsis suecica]|uniref:Uncharacterized protein n=1 Tax=Arabidopsis suecica TaxID=45249 RepID=A0A8T2AM08_ARASU|nr:hypothetical protein ISN44_As09g022200 [Arabidopsis suecica]